MAEAQAAVAQVKRTEVEAFPLRAWPKFTRVPVEARCRESVSLRNEGRVLARLTEGRKPTTAAASHSIINVARYLF